MGGGPRPPLPHLNSPPSAYTVFHSYTFNLYTIHWCTFHSYYFSIVYFSFVYFSFVYFSFVYFSIAHFSFIHFSFVFELKHANEKTYKKYTNKKSKWMIRIRVKSMQTEKYRLKKSLQLSF